MNGTPWIIGKKQAESNSGIVVCQHWKAAEAGAAILRAGGNAIDAAVAAALVLGVVEPWLSGIGGGGFLTVRDGATGAVKVLDFSIAASTHLDPAAYPLDGSAEDGAWFKWPRVKDGRNLHGYLSIGVPGAIAGFAEMLRSLGTMPWEQVIEPAIAEAEAGIELDWPTAVALSMDADILLKYPESAALWLPEGRVGRVSSAARPDRLPMPALAETLRVLRDKGPEDFYTGETAEKLCADLRRGGSPIAEDDLAAYRPIWKTPAKGTYRGRTVYAVPGNSAGPSLLRALAWLESRLEGRPGGRPSPEDALHYAEACRTEYRYRLTSMGHSGTSSNEQDPSCTSNLCVVDRNGTVVALTNTLLSRFGSRVTSPSLGFLLNNGIMWFDPRPGQPNSITPGVRPLANMCPIVVEDGARNWAFGGAGGRTIFPTLLQIMSGVFDFGMTLEQAFTMPRIDASTETIRVPSHAPAGTAEAIARKFAVEVVEDTFYPVRFSLPSAVCASADGTNIGMAHHNSPWAGAALENA